MRRDLKNRSRGLLPRGARSGKGSNERAQLVANILDEVLRSSGCNPAVQSLVRCELGLLVPGSAWACTTIGLESNRSRRQCFWQGGIKAANQSGARQVQSWSICP